MRSYCSPFVLCLVLRSCLPRIGIRISPTFGSEKNKKFLVFFCMSQCWKFYLFTYRTLDVRMNDASKKRKCIKFWRCGSIFLLVCWRKWKYKNTNNRIWWEVEMLCTLKFTDIYLLKVSSTNKGLINQVRYTSNIWTDNILTFPFRNLFNSLWEMV